MDRLSGLLIAFVALALPSAFLLVMGSRRFRRLIAKVILVIAAIIIGVYFYATRQHELSRSKIPPAQLALQDLKFDSQFGNYRLRGRVQNNSPSFTVKCMTLEIVASDCPVKTHRKPCKTIGDEKENVCVEVASGKSANFETYVYFPGGPLAPKGRLSWNCKVSETFSE